MASDRFTSDGCTFAPNLWFRQACVDHDFDYWIGGTEEDRLAADIRLRETIILTAKTPGQKALAPSVAATYFRFVRIFGSNHWPYSHNFCYKGKGNDDEEMLTVDA